MKRSQKKLTLHRETVRPLQDLGALGGNIYTPNNGCVSAACPTVNPWTCMSTCTNCFGCGPTGGVIVPTS